jgi:hypothetical protein
MTNFKIRIRARVLYSLYHNMIKRINIKPALKKNYFILFFFFE